MYYLTIRNKRHEVSAMTFWSIFTVIGALLITVVVFLVYCLFFTFGYYSILVVALCTSVTVTTNGKQEVYALIKNSALRGFLSATVVVVCVVYTAYYHLVG